MADHTPSVLHFLLSPHISTSKEHQSEQPRTPDEPTITVALPRAQAGSLPAAVAFVLGRRNSCCPAAHCSLLSTAGEKEERSVMVGHTGSSLLCPAPPGRVPPY